MELACCVTTRAPPHRYPSRAGTCLSTQPQSRLPRDGQRCHPPSNNHGAWAPQSGHFPFDGRQSDSPAVAPAWSTPPMGIRRHDQGRDPLESPFLGTRSIRRDGVPDAYARLPRGPCVPPATCDAAAAAWRPATDGAVSGIRATGSNAGSTGKVDRPGRNHAAGKLAAEGFGFWRIALDGGYDGSLPREVLLPRAARATRTSRLGIFVASRPRWTTNTKFNLPGSPATTARSACTLATDGMTVDHSFRDNLQSRPSLTRLGQQSRCCLARRREEHGEVDQPEMLCPLK